jgi:AcrR family transcriptional regulator
MSTRIRRPPLHPRKSPRQRRSRDTVEHVLAAAAQIFDRHGLDGGTTNRIAERAGVSVGTLYQYFPSKEALAVALAERHVARTAASVDAWLSRARAGRAPLRTVLRELGALLLEVHEEHPRLHRTLLEDLALPPRLHAEIQQAERAAAAAVAALLRGRPEVRRDPGGAAPVVVQVALSLVHRFTARPVESRRRFLDGLVEVLHAFLTSADAAR